MNRLTAILTVVSVLVCGGLSAAESDANDINILKRTSKAFSEVAKKTMPAVVYVEVKKVVGYTRQYVRDPQEEDTDPFGFRPRRWGYDRYRIVPYEVSGFGSGFLISRDGYILTNNHIVGDADEITVKMKDGREFKAKRIGSDSRSDVALVKIDGKDFPYIELGDSSKLEIGEWVIAIGNPLGMTHTLTVGVVSAVGRSNLGISEYEDFIQTDAAINQGNSGGPLINLDGKAVGINSAIISMSGGYVGIGLAVPMNMAIAIKDQLVKNNGRVIRGYIGVQLDPQEMTKELAESHMLKKPGGVVVTEVMQDSPAMKAGLSSGDVILRVDGQAADNVPAFRNKVAMLAPGSKVKLEIMRNGKQMNLDVTIGICPEDDDSIAAAQGRQNAIGFTVVSLTPQIARKLGIKDSEGVVVNEVLPDSPAADAGMEPGLVIVSVNRTKVTSEGDFHKAMQALEDKGKVLFQVKSRGYSWFILINK